MRMVERVARTLCQIDGHPENTVYQGKVMWRSYEHAARAVIGAMREPSLEMLSCPEFEWKAAALHWNAMIDVALQ